MKYIFTGMSTIMGISYCISHVGYERVNLNEGISTFIFSGINANSSPLKDYGFYFRASLSKNVGKPNKDLIHNHSHVVLDSVGSIVSSQNLPIKEIAHSMVGLDLFAKIIGISHSDISFVFGISVNRFVNKFDLSKIENADSRFTVIEYSFLSEDLKWGAGLRSFLVSNEVIFEFKGFVGVSMPVWQSRVNRELEIEDSKERISVLVKQNMQPYASLTKELGIFATKNNWCVFIKASDCTKEMRSEENGDTPVIILVPDIEDGDMKEKIQESFVNSIKFGLIGVLVGINFSY